MCFNFIKRSNKSIKVSYNSHVLSEAEKYKKVSFSLSFKSDEDEEPLGNQEGSQSLCFALRDTQLS